MRIKNSKQWRRYSLTQAWLCAVLITAGAFAIRYGLHPFVEPFAVFHFFTIGCLLIEFLFGYEFVIPSMLASVVLAEYFFVEPYGSFGDLTHKDYLISLNFLVVTGVAVTFMEHLQRSKYTRELLLKVMGSRYQISLERENDRLYYARQSGQASAVLEALLTDPGQVLLMRFGSRDVQPGAGLFRLSSAEQCRDQDWQALFHPDDLTALKRQLDAPQTDAVLHLRLSRANADQPISVEVQHMDFMGQPLIIVQLASQEALAPA